MQPALGAFPEIIELAEGGVIYQPNSPDELAKTIKLLLNDPEKLNDLSERGRKGIEKHFNIQDQALKMVDLYNAITNQKKSKTDDN